MSVEFENACTTPQCATSPDDKVILDLERLPSPIQEALRHLHDADFPIYRTADPTQGTPEETRRRRKKCIRYSPGGLALAAGSD